MHKLSDHDDETKTATCSVCGPTKFKMKKKPQGGFRRSCMTVERGKTTTPTAVASRRRRQFKWRYGLTREEWDARLIAQSGLCAICDEQMMDPFVDHDHETGEVRGLLCSSCNFGLGHFRDSVEFLASAIRYLK